jgi:hypothetical protein
MHLPPPSPRDGHQQSFYSSCIGQGGACPAEMRSFGVISAPRWARSWPPPGHVPVIAQMLTRHLLGTPRSATTSASRHERARDCRALGLYPARLPAVAGPPRLPGQDGGLT